MFGELPKLFDRDFAVGYFIPATAFVAANVVLVIVFGQLQLLYKLFPSLEAALRDDTLKNLTLIVGLASLILAVLLLVLNRQIFRLFEGYGLINNAEWSNPFVLQKSREMKRYEKKKQTRIALQKRWINEGEHFTHEKLLTELTREFVESFPHEKDLVLPTAFGNTIRAFETYSNSMYGIDGIAGWNRLIAVIPNEYKSLLNAAIAETNFWVNFWFLSLVALFEYSYLAFVFRSLPLPFAFILVIAFVWLSSEYAKKAAVEWGDLVKAAFDVFRPELSKMLRLPEFKNRVHEKEIWTKFSQAVIYADTTSLQEIGSEKLSNEDNS